MSENLLQQLRDFGIEDDLGKQALQATGNKTIDAALNWIFDKQNSTSSQPIPSNPEPLIPPELLAKIEVPQKVSKRNKMVLCVRKDLNMSVGKIAAQCSHASLGLYKDLLERKQFSLLRTWDEQGEPTIALAVQNADELFELEKKAEKINLPTHIVTDAGKTQVARGSVTVLAILGPEDIVNSVTGHLKLL